MNLIVSYDFMKKRIMRLITVKLARDIKSLFGGHKQKPKMP